MSGGLALELGHDVALGVFVKFPIVETVELLSIAGFPMIVIDLEHSPMSIESASTLIAVARPRGLRVIVRIPNHGYEWVQRALDAGADGILVPHVDSREEAEAIVAAARFPGNGTRGVGPTSRAGAWGLEPMTQYLSQGEDIVIIAQIESGAAVEAAEDILVSGVSSVFVGPTDLGLSLGVAADSVDLDAACEHVLKSARKANIPCGIAVGTAAAGRDKIADGYSYAVVGNDATMFGQAARMVVNAFNGD